MKTITSSEKFTRTMRRLADACGRVSAQALAHSEQETFYAEAEVACRQAALSASLIFAKKVQLPIPINHDLAITSTNDAV